VSRFLYRAVFDESLQNSALIDRDYKVNSLVVPCLSESIKVHNVSKVQPWK
jgi:hypothetical protein